MSNKLKISFSLIIVVLSISLAEGQDNIDYTDILTNKFNTYCEKLPREEIYSHTDRSEYIAGETAWFSLCVIDRQTGRPSKLSNVVYVELLNSGNRPVVQKKILLRNSYGTGEFKIPDTLSTGSYRMRAYTSWMKNFLPDNCYSFELMIYNVLNTNVIPEKIPSGTTIPGGAGTFGNNRYNGKNLLIITDNDRNDSLVVNIVTDSIFRVKNRSVFYLFMQTHGIIDHTARYNITGDTTRLIFSRDELKSGICQITAFNAEGNPVAEKYIYIPENEEQSLSVKVDDKYGLRDHVFLNIDYNEESQPVKDSVRLSISVSPYTGQSVQEDIADYMVFGSEYGPFPHYFIKGRKISDLPGASLDTLLSGIKSNWIDWRNILSGTLPVTGYKPEKENSILSGRLIYNDARTHNNDIVIMCMPGKYAQFQYSRTDSSGKFRFVLKTGLQARDIIIMPGRINDNTAIVVDSPFSDRYPAIDRQSSQSLTDLPSYIPKWMVNYQVETIYGEASYRMPEKPDTLPEDTISFYGKPDFELKMSDYIRLPRMEEVFFEILPHVSLKKKNNEYEILITDRIDNSPYITLPSLMIDGILINDAQMIADLDPEKVEKIDVIESKYLVGKYLFPGIVNVITKAGDFNSVALPDYMTRIKYRSADPVFTFVSPDYSSDTLRKSTEPDYRNTLYWDPLVNICSGENKTLTFWTSDNSSDYFINIQGITSDGRLVSVHRVIHVR